MAIKICERVGTFWAVVFTWLNSRGFLKNRTTDTRLVYIHLNDFFKDQSKYVIKFLKFWNHFELFYPSSRQVYADGFKSSKILSIC